MKGLNKTSRLSQVMTGRKKLITFATVAVVVIGSMAIYAWWSVAAWANFEKNYTTIQSDTGSQISAVVALPVTTPEEKAKKRTALENVHTSIATHQAMCEIPVFISWQTRFGTVKKYQDECSDVLKKLTSVDESLVVVTGYLRDEQQFAGLVTAASGGASDLDEVVWAETAAKWHTLAVKTKELKVSKAFDEVLKRSITETAHLDACWQEVLAATAAKDRARFQTAKDELSKAYGTFKDMAQLSTATFITLQKQFEVQYVALTK